MISPSEHLARLVGRPESALDVAEAALVIAQQEYPELDTAAYIRQLDIAAERLKCRLPADAGKAHVIAMLNHFLFSELGYVGNRGDYYDPRNSFLNEVIERRIGIPISLSIIYMEIARRLGLALAGVCFPGHFLVKCVTDHGVIVLDPYNSGISLSEATLRKRLAQLNDANWAQRAPLSALLKPATKKEILVRLARNLKGIYSVGGKLEKAVAIINLILVIHPQAPEEIRDRGLIYNRLECYRAALADLQRFVELAPDAESDEPVRALMTDLRLKARLLN